jgi:hypothetical protein
MRNSLPLASYNLPFSTKKPGPVLYEGRETWPLVAAAVEVTETVALCDAEPPVPVQVTE